MCVRLPARSVAPVEQGGEAMPKVSKESAEVAEHGPVTEWHQDVDGYTVNIVRFNQDIDATPLLKGLPDDKCSCAHWGYVLSGRVTFGFDDHEEVMEPGDAFYVPPGHTQRAEAGTEYLQFSPTEDLHAVDEAIMRNMQAMQQA
jgi:mannose-6-phosphate isomerase-like protein (cupin superfamily)